MITVAGAVYALLWTLGLIEVLRPGRPVRKPEGSLLAAFLDQIPFTVTEDETP